MLKQKKVIELEKTERIIGIRYKISENKHWPKGNRFENFEFIIVDIRKLKENQIKARSSQKVADDCGMDFSHSFSGNLDKNNSFSLPDESFSSF